MAGGRAAAGVVRRRPYDPHARRQVRRPDGGAVRQPRLPEIHHAFQGTRSRTLTQYPKNQCIVHTYANEAAAVIIQKAIIFAQFAKGGFCRHCPKSNTLRTMSVLPTNNLLPLMFRGVSQRCGTRRG